MIINKKIVYVEIAMDPPNLSTKIFFYLDAGDMSLFCSMREPNLQNIVLSVLLNRYMQHYIRQSNAKTQDASDKILNKYIMNSVKKNTFTTTITITTQSPQS